MASTTRVGDTPTAGPGLRQRVGTPPGPLLAAGAVVLLRLPFVDGWLGKDEAGYLAVAHQWHAGGTSLYGDYWVDRPPLLITLFRLADLLGGAVPLRLLGILAAVVAVLAVGRAAGTVAGPRAATWAAVVSAAFLVSPLTGATEVNGELLAAPFVAVGIAALLESLATTSRRRAGVAALAAGASGSAAVLVKQNMLDVAVLAAVLLVATARSVGTARVLRVPLGLVAGALLLVGTAAAWTLVHGTGLGGVWFAMYRFRVEAGGVMAAHPSISSLARGRTMLWSTVLTGMVPAAVLLVLGVVRRHHDHPSSSRPASLARAVRLALVVVLGYDALSVYLGGSFWAHYLVQAAVPLGLAVGVAGVRRPRPARVVSGIVVASAAVALVAAGPHPMPAGGNPLGAAIRAVARPGDTIVTIWGHADITRSSGLASPYPYLWYLPARTLDPHVALLDATLRGPRAPTWFVTWAGSGLHGVDTSALRADLSRDYHPVAVNGSSVTYLHDGVQRAQPVLRHHLTA